MDRRFVALLLVLTSTGAANAQTHEGVSFEQATSAYERVVKPKLPAFISELKRAAQGHGVDCDDGGPDTWVEEEPFYAKLGQVNINFSSTDVPFTSVWIECIDSGSGYAMPDASTQGSINWSGWPKGDPRDYDDGKIYWGEFKGELNGRKAKAKAIRYDRFVPLGGGVALKIETYHLLNYDAAAGPKESDYERMARARRELRAAQDKGGSKHPPLWMPHESERSSSRAIIFVKGNGKVVIPENNGAIPRGGDTLAIHTKTESDKLEIDAGSLDSSCVGSVTKKPDFMVWVDEKAPTLRMFAMTRDIGIGILVETPDGDLLCNRRAFGVNVPGVDLVNAAPGLYGVWLSSAQRDVERRWSKKGLSDRHLLLGVSTNNHRPKKSDAPAAMREVFTCSRRRHETRSCNQPRRSGNRWYCQSHCSINRHEWVTDCSDTSAPHCR